MIDAGRVEGEEMSRTSPWLLIDSNFLKWVILEDKWVWGQI